jgi:hypothetical protein
LARRKDRIEDEGADFYVASRKKETHQREMKQLIELVL